MEEIECKLKFSGTPKWIVRATHEWARQEEKTQYFADGTDSILVFSPGAFACIDIREGVIRIEGDQPVVDKIAKHLKKELGTCDEIPYKKREVE